MESATYQKSFHNLQVQTRAKFLLLKPEGLHIDSMTIKMSGIVGLKTIEQFVLAIVQMKCTNLLVQRTDFGSIWVIGVIYQVEIKKPRIPYNSRRYEAFNLRAGRGSNSRPPA